MLCYLLSGSPFFFNQLWKFSHNLLTSADRRFGEVPKHFQRFTEKQICSVPLNNIQVTKSPEISNLFEKMLFSPFSPEIFTIAAQLKEQRRSETDGWAVMLIHLPQQEFFTDLRSRWRANSHSHNLSGLCSQWKVNNTSHLQYWKMLQRLNTMITKTKM